MDLAMDEESHGRTKRQPDKVHDGPCAKEFAAVENCAKAKDEENLYMTLFPSSQLTCTLLYYIA
jgi:hypothetical protein